MNLGQSNSVHQLTVMSSLILKLKRNAKHNKTAMPPIEVIANCELCVTGCTCGHTDCESASGHTALHE